MSDINQPHINDEGPAIGGPPEPPAPTPSAADGPSGPAPVSEPPAPGPAAGELEPDEVAGGVSPPDTPPETAVEPIEPPAAGTEPPAEPRKSTEDRPYVVVQEMELTETLLRNLLAELHGGGPVRRAIFYLREATLARNGDHALHLVRDEMGDRLGLRPKMMAVTAKGWRMRYPVPRERRPSNAVKFTPAE